MTYANQTPPPGISQHQSFGHYVRRFFGDLFRLPWHHKAVLGFAVVLAGLGWGQVNTPAAPATTPQQNGSGTVVAQQQNAPQSADATVTDNSTLDTWARRVGSSILAGYVIGWAFRVFIKTMALVTMIAVGGLALLSYFNIMNVNLTAAEQKAQSASGWVTEQAGKLKDSALKHVHSSGGGLVGAFLGFRKKTMLPQI